MTRTKNTTVISSTLISYLNHDDKISLFSISVGW